MEPGRYERYESNAPIHASGCQGRREQGREPVRPPGHPGRPMNATAAWRTILIEGQTLLRNVLAKAIRLEDRFELLAEVEDPPEDGWNRVGSLSQEAPGKHPDFGPVAVERSLRAEPACRGWRTRLCGEGSLLGGPGGGDDRGGFRQRLLPRGIAPEPGNPAIGPDCVRQDTQRP